MDADRGCHAAGKLLMRWIVSRYLVLELIAKANSLSVVVTNRID